ncbi:hypothetical protein RhiXN_03265 [Rhizoctonia solani]|uniref:Uncharacterized protein n=1 Tax=Rhizoctonia solani TaxID=456999 RepID=A0A8H8STX4_9AGAM|nr:uncharacterized protein RhiXN_03265 [Rhizoctonia solani]QRW18341.1 hypothetical protein RhiXN_03265 [Rhizoctonia solani]
MSTSADDLIWTDSAGRSPIDPFVRGVVIWINYIWAAMSGLAYKRQLVNNQIFNMHSHAAALIIAAMSTAVLAKPIVSEDHRSSSTLESQSLTSVGSDTEEGADAQKGMVIGIESHLSYASIVSTEHKPVETSMSMASPTSSSVFTHVVSSAEPQPTEHKAKLVDGEISSELPVPVFSSIVASSDYISSAHPSYTSSVIDNSANATSTLVSDVPWPTSSVENTAHETTSCTPIASGNSTKPEPTLVYTSANNSPSGLAPSSILP